ncbi:hypothetical protein ACHAXS_004238 [Conticribra weissflogii]
MYFLFHCIISTGPTPSATSTSPSAESQPAASSWNCAQTSSPKPPRTSALFAPERRDLDTPEAVSTVSFPDSCAREGISPTTMELEGSLSMETNSPTRTLPSSTPNNIFIFTDQDLESFPWPTPDLTPTDHNFSFALRRPHGLTESTLSSDLSCKGWMLSRRLKVLDPTADKPRLPL